MAQLHVNVRMEGQWRQFQFDVTELKTWDDVIARVRDVEGAPQDDDLWLAPNGDGNVLRDWSPAVFVQRSKFPLVTVFPSVRLDPPLPPEEVNCCDVWASWKHAWDSGVRAQVPTAAAAADTLDPRRGTDMQ